MKVSLAVACLCLLAPAGETVPRAPAPPPAVSHSPTIEPDPLLQEQLTAVGKLLGSRGRDDKVVVSAKFALQQAKRRKDVLLPQLVWYLAHGHPEEPRLAEKVLLGLGAFEGIRGSDAVSALAPFLTATDARLREGAERLIEMSGAFRVLRRFGEVPRFPELESYLAVVRDHPVDREPPLFLTSRMFREDPTAALMAFTPLYLSAPGERKEVERLLLADREIDTFGWRLNHGFIAPAEMDVAARKAVTELTTLDYWWARLYAVEIMRRYRGLRDAKVIEKLVEDPHVAVRRGALDLLDAR